MRKVHDLTDAVLSYNPDADVDIILDAYLYSAKAHRGQSRRSGEAYISHPMEVAFNLTKLKVDEKTVAAGLLHDTIEDTLTTPDEMRELFGEEVFQLVDGVTKIGMIEFSSREESQAENYRKMILAMARDIRVVLIKLADRAHNVLTLGSLSEERQKRIARETLDIYAPIANRLGISWLKNDLENESFKYLFSEDYRFIINKIAQGQEERKKYVELVCGMIQETLDSAQIQAAVGGRPKHLYSIFRKMTDQNISFNEVYDLIGVRVLTEDLKDCYAVLGLIHSLWKPIPGRFKDYIAMPKPNMYQSLHTTVIGPKGERVEVQIRTREMHRICEEGIAAHWQYKESVKGKTSPLDQQLSWVRHLLENQKDLKNPKEFLHAFKVNLFPHEVYVFTPDGDVISLPHNSTPVDFAYAVHTDIGNHCMTARVDGKAVPLRHKLINGNRVEIITSKKQHPSQDWLSFVKTSKARSKITHFINNTEKELSLRLGREMLEKQIRNYGFKPSQVLKGKELEETIQGCGYNSYDSLLIAIGLGKVSVRHAIDKLLPKEALDRKKTDETTPVKLKEKSRKPTQGNAIKVECLNDNILLRFGKCCNPVPGDPIIGYITRGRGVTVHHIDCPGVVNFSSESERLIHVEWDTDKKTIYPTRISIVGQDKPGLLANISSVLAKCDINIVRANVQQGSHKRAYFDLYIEIHDVEQLNHMLDKVRAVDGVIHLERVKEYKRKSPRENPGAQDTGAEEEHELLVN